MLQCPDEIRLHIGISLARSHRFRLHLTQLLQLVRDQLQHLSHTVLGRGAGARYAGQLQIDTFRVIVHVVEIGESHELFDVLVVDPAHCLQLLPLTIQVRITGGGAVRFREDLTDEVVDLGVG